MGVLLFAVGTAEPYEIATIDGVTATCEADGGPATLVGGESASEFGGNYTTSTDS